MISGRLGLQKPDRFPTISLPKIDCQKYPTVVTQELAANQSKARWFSKKVNGLGLNQEPVGNTIREKQMLLLSFSSPSPMFLHVSQMRSNEKQCATFLNFFTATQLAANLSDVNQFAL